MSFKRIQPITWEGIPKAPLIRETVTRIDQQFMKIKASIQHEIPILSAEDLIRKRSNYEILVSELGTQGFHRSAAEIMQLIDEEKNERDIAKKQGKPMPRKGSRLGDDMWILKKLSTSLKDAEDFARTRKWKEMIISRLCIAEELKKIKEHWLASQIILSTLECAKKLNVIDPEDRIIAAEVHLTWAFLQHQKNDWDKDEVLRHLQKCKYLTKDHRDKTMYHIMPHGGMERRKGLVTVVIHRPIAMHGWKKFKGLANLSYAISTENTSLFRLACVLHSICLLEDLKRKGVIQASMVALSSKGSGNNMAELHIQNQAKPEEIEQTYLKAIDSALDGDITSQIFEGMYAYARYLIDTVWDFSKASNILNQMSLKSILWDDSETVGVVLNSLGMLSYRMFDTYEAVRYLCEEWYTGRDNNLPIIEVDALQDLTRILLEEGHDECEHMAWYALELLTDFVEKIEKVGPSTSSSSSSSALVIKKTKSKMTSKPKAKEAANKPIFPLNLRQSDKYLLSWVMAGLSSGQRIWPRFASHCKANHSLAIAKWKTSRNPFLPVCTHPHTFKTIESVVRKDSSALITTRKYKQSRDEDIPYVIRKPTTEDHKLLHLMHSVENENFQFQSDKALDEQLVTRGKEVEIVHESSYLQLLEEGEMEDAELVTLIEEAKDKLRRLSSEFGVSAAMNKILQKYAGIQQMQKAEETTAVKTEEDENEEGELDTMDFEGDDEFSFDYHTENAEEISMFDYYEYGEESGEHEMELQHTSFGVMSFPGEFPGEDLSQNLPHVPQVSPEATDVEDIEQ